MTQPTIDVLDANGAQQTIFSINPNGRAAAADSQCVALSTEDKAVADAILASQGDKSDAAATDTSSSWSIVALLKGVLSRLIPGGPQTGGGAITDTTQRMTLATDGPGVSNLVNIDAKLPALVGGKQPSEPLGSLGVSRTLPVTGTAASATLTTTCRRVSLVALTADLCLTVDGTTATTSSHYLQAGERIDLLLTAATTISAIRAGATDAVLRISELV